MKYWILFFELGCFCINLAAQEPKLLIPIGHKMPINAAAFSPDNKYVITAGQDESAIVWDASDGKMLMQLQGHQNSVQFAAFSPDGKLIVTASYDNTARIWNAADGSLLKELKGHTGSISKAVFSPDGKTIVTASWDNTSRIWDVATGKLLVLLKGHRSYVNAVSFSPDGKYIATGSYDTTIRIWNVQTGTSIRILKGHASVINAIACSPDGKYIASASQDNTIKIWDAANGTLVKNLQGVKVGEVGFVDVNYSPNGRYIISTQGDNKIRRWNIESGQTDSIYAFKAMEEAWRAAYSPDGKNLIVNFYKLPYATVLNVENKKLTVFSGKIQPKFSTNAAFSPDGHQLLTTSADYAAKTWNTDNGKLLQTFFAEGSLIHYASYSPDGRYIVGACKDSTVRIWNASDGTILHRLAGHSRRVNTAVYSPDGKLILTASRDSTIRIWQASDGKLIKILPVIVNKPMVASTATFSPDGQFILACSDMGGVLMTCEISTGKWKQFKEAGDAKGAAWSPDGKYLAATYYADYFSIVNAVTGAMVKKIKGHDGLITDAQFSPDGKKIITASYDNTAKIWDAATGLLLKTLKGHTYWVKSAQYSRDGKYILTTSLDLTNKLWDARTGKQLYTLLSIDSTDYLATDQFNRFDGTERARKLLYFVCGREPIDLDQIKDQIWIPNLAERVLNGDSIHAPKLADLHICGLTPLVDQKGLSGNQYHFTITPRSGGLGETILYVNGNETKRYKPEQLQKTKDGYELLITKDELKENFIVGQENPITVKAFTASNDISSRGAVVVQQPENKNAVAPNLYAVMVGVSDYKGDELDLKYAAKDAGDLSRAIENAAKKWLNKDGKDHVFMYNLTTEKEHYQLPEKNSIRQTLEEIGKKASANDILLIFFAGHGVMEGNDKKQFYFLTADASRASATGNAVVNVGISTQELSNWIQPANIKAQKRILILDACNSGQAINDLVKIGQQDQNFLAARNDDDAQQIKSIDKLNEHSGLFTLAASASNQSAYEMGRYSQGLLTYVLLKAIKQNPAVLEDNLYLNISRWFGAAENTVTELVKETGARQQPQIVSTTNFNIGVVDEEVMKKIILADEKPLFAASNFQNQNEEIAADDLGLNRLTDQQLNDLSARGTNAPISFAPSSASPDAYSLSGRYSITGNAVAVKVFVRKNNIANHRFDLRGTTDKLAELAKAIAAQATELITSGH